MRLKPFVTSLITVLCALFFMRAAPAEVVSIWDEDLRAAILKKLNKPNPKAAITKSDMLHLTELRLEEVDFFTLTGLEHATNLKHFISAGIPQCIPGREAATPRMSHRSQP